MVFAIFFGEVKTWLLQGLLQGTRAGADIQTLVVFFLPRQSRYFFSKKLFSRSIPCVVGVKIIIFRATTFVQTLLSSLCQKSDFQNLMALREKD